MLNYSLLPAHLRGGMKRYVENGIKPGHFLTAVLENDLLEAFKQADAESAASLPQLVGFIYNELPGDSHGSKQRMGDWMKSRQEDDSATPLDLLDDNGLVELGKEARQSSLDAHSKVVPVEDAWSFAVENLIDNDAQHEQCRAMHDAPIAFITGYLDV